MELKKDLKNIINQQQAQIDKQQEINQQLEKQLQNLQNQNMKLQAENFTINLNNANPTIDTLPKNPFFDFDLNKIKVLNGEYMNYINKLNAREAQFGSTSDTTQGFLVYLLILERARYFKNRVLIKNCDNRDLEDLIYNCFYHTALSGIAGIYFNNGIPYLVQVSNCVYNLEGKLIKAEINYINWKNSTEWNVKPKHLNKKECENLAVCVFNNEQFGLWVLAYFYLNKICEYFQILDTQTQFLNKKFGVQNDTNKAGIDNSIYQSLLARNTPLVVVKDLSKIQVLNMPEIDLNKIFELIVNFINWFDNHILGIRTKDIDPSDKAREIVANSGINGAQASKQEQNINYFVDNFLQAINKITGYNIDWLDLNISLNSQLITSSNTTDKISTSKED